MDPNNVGRGFRGSPWRYSQFVVVALIVGVMVKWLSPLGWPLSLAIGAAAGVGYLLLEKKRGVI